MSAENIGKGPILPRYMVTHHILHDEPVERAVSLEMSFPEPKPKVASEKQLQKLGCPEDLISLARELKDPWKVQDYINSHFTYDHSDDTRGFVGVARDNLAHCFEGAIFAYTALWFHGWDPKVVLLQADNNYGEDHNIVVYRYKNRLGSVAMSNWQTLKSRPPVFSNLRDLVGFGYWNEYTSELPGYDGVHNLVGFTDPINLVEKFGNTSWMFKEGREATLPIFENFVRGATCTNLFTGERYKYVDEEFKNDPTDDVISR